MPMIMCNWQKIWVSADSQLEIKRRVLDDLVHFVDET